MIPIWRTKRCSRIGVSRSGGFASLCWELKYCPYGPLVEQSPVVPPLRSGMIEQNAYFRKCLETDMVSDVRTLTEEIRAEYQEWLEDDQLLLRQALHEVRSQHALEDAARAPDEQQQIAVWLGGDIPPSRKSGRKIFPAISGRSFFLRWSVENKSISIACHRGG